MLFNFEKQPAIKANKLVYQRFIWALMTGAWYNYLFSRTAHTLLVSSQSGPFTLHTSLPLSLSLFTEKQPHTPTESSDVTAQTTCITTITPWSGFGCLVQ